MDTATIVVVVIGVATVAATIYGAHLQAGVATAQLEASQAATARELSAVLVIGKATGNSPASTVQIHNAGPYPASSVRLTALSEHNEPLFSSEVLPIVPVGTSTAAEFYTQETAQRDRFRAEVCPAPS